MKSKGVVKIDLANTLYEDLKRIQYAYKTIWFERARILKQIKDTRSYKYINGLGYLSWEEFCSDPIVGMSRVTANLHISLYEYYVEQLKLSEEQLSDIPIGRLTKILNSPDLTDEQRELSLVDAKLLSDRDFYKSMDERLGGKPDRPTLYLNGATQKWVFKFTPDTMEKIVDESEDKIIWQNT